LGDIETIALYRTGGRGISKAEILVLHLNCFGPPPRCFYFRSLVLAVVFRAFGQSPTDVEVAVFLYLGTREKELNCKVLTTLPCLGSTARLLKVSCRISFHQWHLAHIGSNRVLQRY
jgi:hypothetical protein